MQSNQLDYEVLKRRRPADGDIALLKEQLQRLSQKEARIKEAYRNGVDTLEEYKENKDLLQAERKKLESQLKEKTVIDIDYSPVVLDHIRTAVDVLKNPEADYDKKAAAIRSVVEKIIYDRSSDSLSVYYYYS